MANVLLVEPDYRSKFPPLGLMRISTYHKSIGDTVTFCRGMKPELRAEKWDKIYVSSLFTYELPRTVKTIKYYRACVSSPNDIITGGIAVTLMPDYVKKEVDCRIIEGQLSAPNIIDNEKKALCTYTPDYSIIDSPNYEFTPKNSYFCRVTEGCIRKCKFCAVPKLEPQFKFLKSLKEQIMEVEVTYGIRQNLVLLDNNILASRVLPDFVNDIHDCGFGKGAMLYSKKRTVDFNQGIDARLINNKTAEMLGRLALSPVRLAFDNLAIENAYKNAILLLAKNGFRNFTNYILFNFNDSPEDFFYRIRLNVELSRELGVRITGFPMKYVPINNITRKYIGKNWNWKYLRGLQCILLATHGIVSPNIDFFNRAFGESVEEFKKILSMPDRYIIYREKYEKKEASNWRKLFDTQSDSAKEEFLDLLAKIHITNNKTVLSKQSKTFAKLLEHYYSENLGSKTQ